MAHVLFDDVGGDRPLRQADGPQRPALDRRRPRCCSTARTPTARDRSPRRRGRRRRRARSATASSSPRCAVGAHRGLLAPAARRLPRRSRGRSPVVVHDAPLGLLHRLRADRPDPGIVGRALAAPARREADVGRRLSTRADDPARASDRSDCRQRPRRPRRRSPRPLPRSFARRLLAEPGIGRHRRWLEPCHIRIRPEAAHRLAEDLRAAAGGRGTDRSEALTFDRRRRAARSRSPSGTRSHGCSAAGSRTGTTPTAPATRPRARRCRARPPRPRAGWATTCSRDTARSIAAAGMSGPGPGRRPAVPLADGLRPRLVGRLASRTREREPRERDLIVVIPGRDRSQAVIMADHYDTAYMEDRYSEARERRPALAAPGADDNTLGDRRPARWPRRRCWTWPARAGSGATSGSST